MGSPTRVSRAIRRLVLVLSALACAPQASAAFFLDLTVVSVLAFLTLRRRAP